MAAAYETRVRGLRELQSDLRKVDREAAGEVRAALKDIGEPIRADAQARAFSEIRNIGSQWGKIRLGVTMKSVYIVPATKNRGGSKRWNLGALLMTRAMVPAAESHTDDVEYGLYRAMDHLLDRHRL